MDNRELLRLTNLDTGEIYEKVTKIETLKEEQSKKKYRKMSGEKQEIRDLLGGFVFKKNSNTALKIDNILSNQELTRVMYLITFINYDNKIMFDAGKPMNKKDIKNLTGISERLFYKWYNKMIKLKVILEKDNGIYINEKYSFKGEIKKPKNINRVFINAVREIYEANSNKNIALLGIVIRIIPHTHKFTNMICYNPDEEKLENVKYATLKDISNIIGEYNNRNYHILKRQLGQFRLNNGEPILMFIEDGVSSDALLVMNPRITQSGKLEHMKVLSEMFRVSGETYNLTHKNDKILKTKKSEING